MAQGHFLLCISSHMMPVTHYFVWSQVNLSCSEVILQEVLPSGNNTALKSYKAQGQDKIHCSTWINKNKYFRSNNYFPLLSKEKEKKIKKRKKIIFLLKRKKSVFIFLVDNTSSAKSDFSKYLSLY